MAAFQETRAQVWRLVRGGDSAWPAPSRHDPARRAEACMSSAALSQSQVQAKSVASTNHWRMGDFLFQLTEWPYRD